MIRQIRWRNLCCKVTLKGREHEAALYWISYIRKSTQSTVVKSTKVENHAIAWIAILVLSTLKPKQGRTGPGRFWCAKSLNLTLMSSSRELPTNGEGEPQLYPLTLQQPRPLYQERPNKKVIFFVWNSALLNYAIHIVQTYPRDVSI